MSDEIKAHKSDPYAIRFRPHKWEQEKRSLTPYIHGYRTCSYCGSIHPEDLLTCLESNPDVKLETADWKYGWPHKWYMHRVPNHQAGKVVELGGKWEDNHYTPHLGQAPAFCQVKFYSVHMLDLADGVFDKVANVIAERGGIKFLMATNDAGELTLHYTRYTKP